MNRTETKPDHPEHFTEEELKAWSVDESLRRRIGEFLAEENEQASTDN